MDITGLNPIKIHFIWSKVVMCVNNKKLSLIVMSYQWHLFWRLNCLMFQTDFMGPLMSSYGKSNILLVINYVSKWVEVVSLQKNDGKSIAGFWRWKRVINSRGSHFCNKVFSTFISKYGVKQHNVVTPYTPQNKWLSKSVKQRNQINIGEDSECQ